SPRRRPCPRPDRPSHAGHSAAPTTAVGVLGADVPGRVEALLAPAPRTRPVVAAALAALTLIAVLAAAGVQHTGERLFEHASATRSQTTLDHQLGLPPQPDEPCSGRLPVFEQAHAGTCGQCGRSPPLATPRYV